MNKPWPDNNAIAAFADIVSPIRDAVNQAYSLKRKHGTIKWSGLDIGHKEKVGCFSPDEDLSVNSLAYHAERDRDPMDVIIGIAVRLGIEQGRLRAEETHQGLVYLAEDLVRLAGRAERLSKP